jgi:anaerobic magnesium-protoporphyrin IX monomethyl ester cyclase
MMNKKIKPEYFKEHVQILKEVGIQLSNSIVFGYPIETEETIQETIDLCLEVGIYPSIGFLLPLPYTGMYKWAIENNYITDEDAYLDSISERQDLCINMTKLTDDQIMNKIKSGAAQLNKRLEVGLTEDSLIRTGSYKNHNKNQTQTDKNVPLDLENMERIENDVTFNYSKAIFDIDLGTGTKLKTKN